MTKILENIEKYILCLAVVIYPIFVLTNNTSPAVFPKAELLFAAVSISVILWLVKIAVKGSFTFAFGKFDFAVLLIAIAYLLSTVFATPNKMEAFLIPGITAFVLLGAIFYFLANQLDKKGKIALEISFFLSGLFLSLSIIFVQIGFFAKIPQLPSIIKDSSFNPLGGSIPAGLYLIPAFFAGIALILKDKDVVKRIFWIVAEAVILMAAVIIISQSLPGKPQYPRLPNFAVTWEVAVQTLAKSPIFGIGPANYLSAFNQFRPISYNSSDLWATRFTTATDFYLTVLTETGLLGLIGFAVLLISFYKAFTLDPKNVEKIGLAALIIALALLPASPVIIVPLFIILSLASSSETNIKSAAFSPKFLAYIFAALILVGIGLIGFYGAKIVLAESTFSKSLNALAKNDGKATFDLMQKAVNQNPDVDRYHASLAQVDMALAQSLAVKKNLTDNDKTTITQLVQSAINEGKATVVLNPARSGNWEVLATIYRSIMPFAQGADQFTIQTYTQAVALDPTNPSLRIALGGVYYALGRYDDAIDGFKLAVLAKPDLANAHYNLAIAYREKKDFTNAISEMKKVLTLVDKNSNDYTTAQNALSDLEKNQPPSAKATEGQSLIAPQPIGTSNIKPPITLPQEATPPAATK